MMRFWDKVDQNGPVSHLGTRCWLWTGYIMEKGYGQFRFNGKTTRVHRVAYTLLVGPIPDGIQVDHLCWVRHCVNPEHLRLATNKQNEENRSGPARNGSSGVRGVSWSKERGKWVAQVGSGGRNYFGGRYASREEAEAAVIALRNLLHTHNQDGRRE